MELLNITRHYLDLIGYIAKAIVVVGDHKQISPQFIGIDKQAVALLRSRLINDLPYSDVLAIDNSFFDLAFIRYKGQICLREHFHCMPEIIQFSNNLCYSEMPLIPIIKTEGPIICHRAYRLYGADVLYSWRQNLGGGGSGKTVP